MKTAPMNDRYVKRAYTVEALAGEIGKSPSYVLQLIRENRIAAHKAGKTPIILAADYEAYLESLPES